MEPRFIIDRTGSTFDAGEDHREKASLLVPMDGCDHARDRAGWGMFEAGQILEVDRCDRYKPGHPFDDDSSENRACQTRPQAR